MPDRPTFSWQQLRSRSVFEDDDVLVLDKPAGISIMGERHDTDVTALAAEAGEDLRWVHRIDKVTSGVVVLAKSRQAHGPLTKQFAARTVDKSYLAITASPGLDGHGTIDLPLGVGRKNTVRVAAPREAIAYDPAGRRWSVPPHEVRTGPKVYASTTHYEALGHDDDHTVLRVDPVTGRRHQIRVHLAWCGHPLVGDPLFDRTAAADDRRCCLHSWKLALNLPSGERRAFRADPGPDFWAGTALTAERIETLLNG